MEMLREMAVFVQVVDSGGFSAAARQLGLDTSAVSRHVARLEAHMGARLLQRTTRSVALTELGRQVHEGSVRMLAEARDVHALAGAYNARPTGVIRVSAPIVLGEVWLAPRLPRFLELYPDVDVRLTLVDRTVDLIEEGEDLAIRIGREVAPGLATRALFSVNYVLLAAPSYLAEHGEPAHPAELAGHRCIGLRHFELGVAWDFKRGADSVQLPAPTRLAINNSAAVLAAVRAGGGIGLMTDFAAREAIEQGSVRQVLGDWALGERHARTVHAVYVPGRHLALKVRAFIDYLLA
jgi:DNA-binding transcriptional LysR family regulator